ncbi:MAG: ATP-dependent sacrificial sulfur transferase LarE, partial [Fibrobacter sp.]|nr:ATP-dependent sacrificial sulfur transferase LarE [Fibrobacter sp.]
MEKLKKLYGFFERYESAAVAFSAGVDSTFLAYIAGEVLVKNCLLVTVDSPLIPVSELNEAIEWAKKMNLKHTIINSSILEVPQFCANHEDRCYVCKKNIFSLIKETAAVQNCDVVVEGSNIDDTKDYRPGLKAIKELEVISPLAELGFCKEEIRNYSQKLGLKTASKPSYACLASRIPYFDLITKEKLKKIEISEQAIAKIGFHQLRVRCRGELACIEVLPEEMELAWSRKDLLCK